MTGLLEGLKALGTARLAALGMVAVVLLGLLAVLATRTPTERMALLYADLDGREAAQMVDALDHQQIPYQLGAGGTEILVPTDRVAAARVLLAIAAGLYVPSANALAGTLLKPEHRGSALAVVVYVLSAVLGVAALAGAAWLIVRLLRRRQPSG